MTSKDGMRHVPLNNGMQRTALRTAADAERYADSTGAPMYLMPRRPYVTNSADEVFARAHALADHRGDEDVTPVHLTLCMLREGLNSGAQILLYSCQIPGETVLRELEALLRPAGGAQPTIRPLAWSSSDERMLDLAAQESRALGREYYSCEHVLLAILRDETAPTAQVLAHHGVDYERVRNDVVSIYNRTMEWAGPAA